MNWKWIAIFALCGCGPSTAPVHNPYSFEGEAVLEGFESVETGPLTTLELREMEEETTAQ